jgi:hypothetical protein
MGDIRAVLHYPRPRRADWGTGRPKPVAEVRYRSGAIRDGVLLSVG